MVPLDVDHLAGSSDNLPVAVEKSGSSLVTFPYGPDLIEPAVAVLKAGYLVEVDEIPEVYPAIPLVIRHVGFHGVERGLVLVGKVRVRQDDPPLRLFHLSPRSTGCGTPSSACASRK